MPSIGSRSLVSGATPLFALSFVAIDVETTGLDPAIARLVELAAIPVAGHNILADRSLVSRVNPGTPIPPSSTAIHHISDADVASAPRARQVLAHLQQLIGGQLVVGHAVGFDLAILASEARREGIEWTKPRALCVRTLAMIAAPDLADHSLDGLAQWLDIHIGDRHSARGDADAAARIFFALAPKLEARGIVTLAQAERASRRQSHSRSEASAGWVEPVGPVSGIQGYLSATETFAYRHLVEEVMSSGSLAVVADADPLRSAMTKMVERNISSVLVAKDRASNQPLDAYGILTERDVLRLIVAQGAAVLKRPCGEVATRPLHSIRAKAFLYRASARLSRLGIRHLAVRSDSGTLVGIVSARDLLGAQSGPATALEDAIEIAETPRALATAWAKLPAVAAALVGEGIDARLVCRVVSEEIRAMSRRAAILAERSMVESGNGAAPAPYALLVLGSAGRGESLLAPDQDNAVVFEGTPDEVAEGSAADTWFAEWAVQMTSILDQAGIPLCAGGVMARNPQWRGSVATWHRRIAGWISRSSPQDLLNVDIFFDMIPVHGDIDLGNKLFQRAYASAAANAPFAKLMGAGLDVAEPFTLFGGLKLESGRIDLKAVGLFPIVKLARSLCIRHGYPLRATSERLRALGKRAEAEADLETLDGDHAVLLAALLKQQAADIEAGLSPSNRLDPRSLTAVELDRVKSAIRHVRSVPALIQDLMF